MSESIDDLLELPEDTGDFEIGDDEEEALLDDSYDVTNKTVNSTEDIGHNDEEDVLDLDYTTELNDEDSTFEQEENNRQDKFITERPSQPCDEPVAKKIFINKSNQRPNNQSFRGRRQQYNSNRPNLQNRSYQQNKRVLVNPHFKGNVPIRNNVSLVWDKNFSNIKKPAVHVQPWAHQTAPIFPTQRYENHYQAPTHQIPQPIHVTQRLGNVFNTQPFLNLSNQQFQPQMCPVQPYPQPQQYQNYINQYQQALQQSQSLQQPLHIFNRPPPPIQYGNSPMFARPPPAETYSTPITAQYNNVYDNQRGRMSDDGGNRKKWNIVNMGPQARRKYQQGSREFRNRTVVPSNLQEVRTSDVIIDEKPIIAIKIEKDTLEEDDQMKEYQRLIDQQKRIRELILHRKEERRQIAAKQNQWGPESVDKELVPPPTQLISTIELPTLHNKKSQELKNVTKTILNRNASKSEENDDKVDKAAISSFLSNRTIFAKEDTLPDTSVVVVSNLATGSTEVRLRKLCKGVGDVMNLQLSALERQATIQFKSVASAHAFFKKYQRYMLDLSVIDVTLKK